MYFAIEKAYINNRTKINLRCIILLVFKFNCCMESAAANSLKLPFLNVHKQLAVCKDIFLKKKNYEYERSFPWTGFY